MKTALLSLLLSLSLAAQNLFIDHINRGKELAASKKWAEARKEFWAARGEASGEKENASAAYRIAQTYRGEDNIGAALDWYQQSLRYFSSTQAENEMIALEMQQVGKPVSAIEIKKELTVPQVDRSPTPEPISIDIDILFDRAKATLTPEGRDQVHQLGLALAADELKSKSFLITGHADVTGDPGKNMTLSVLRAQTVRDTLLADSSIPTTRLKCEGKGQMEPKYKSTSDDALRLNRRVRVTVLD